MFIFRHNQKDSSIFQTNKNYLDKSTSFESSISSLLTINNNHQLEINAKGSKDFTNFSLNNLKNFNILNSENSLLVKSGIIIHKGKEERLNGFNGILAHSSCEFNYRYNNNKDDFYVDLNAIIRSQYFLFY